MVKQKFHGMKKNETTRLFLYFSPTIKKNMQSFWQHAFLLQKEQPVV